MISDALKRIYPFRGLVYSIVVRDLRSRYVGSLFGILWLLLPPVFMVLVYTVVFGAGIYYMLRLIKLGPALSTPLDAVQDTGPGHFKTPLRPLSAVEESIETTDPSAQNSKEKPHD